MEEMEIRANGLLLRPWQAQDAPDVYRACQDPEIQRWTGVTNPYLPEHAERFVTSFTREAWAAGTSAPLGVFDPDTGELLGSNGLITLSGHEAEVGYWVAPWARGRGVATRATHAVAAWCLHALGLTRLAWRAQVGNHSSRLIAERLGFRLEGVLRNSGGRRGRTPVDCWSAALIPGQLRSPDDPVDPVLRLRALTLGAPPPRLSTTTATGETVVLRRPLARDVDAIVAACRDPEALQWTTVPEPYRTTDAEFFVDDHAPGRWARGEGGVFALAGPDDGYAGSMELRIVGPDVGDVGYLVAPWARGRGYASAALATLCRWGFEALALRRIEWRAYVGNKGSRRVAQRAGFTMEGLARGGCVQHGAPRDAWTGALLTTDPPAGHPYTVLTGADVGSG